MTDAAVMVAGGERTGTGFRPVPGPVDPGVPMATGGDPIRGGALHAVEAALRGARRAIGRSGVVVCHGRFHGRTLAAEPRTPWGRL
ncbi:hypothetical protein OG426_04195 [Streptomyces canus]|uniref:hypothetical protein n=1 Tax=Streptomyces canus TaxID=58343 RepID=UPI0038672D3A|nr:hypothetical protein OG426_04195 [Streptomyces canus]